MSMYDDASKRVGGGLYLKLTAGEQRIRIVEHPYVSNKPPFKEGDPFRTVFSWLIWNYEEQRLQVLEQGPGLFNMVKAIVKVYGEEMPMPCDLVITTTGSGLEVKRTVVPAPLLGTMPNTSTLQTQNGGRDWPDVERLSRGIPLAQFAKQGLPEDKEPSKPTHLEAEALNRADGNNDVVIQDFDPEQEINLEDIPF